MRVKKSEIKDFVPKIFKKKEPVVPASEDRTDEVLAAIKDIKVEPPVVDHKISEEILTQQKAMMEKISEVPVSPEFPSYHFDINRSSDGFIKSVDATPVKTDGVDQRDIAKSWYKE